MKLEKDHLLLLYTNMVRNRKLDDLAMKGIEEGKLGFYHSGWGMEAVAAGAGTFLRKDDYVFTCHRSHGAGYIIAKGGSVEELKSFMAEHHGKVTGCCKGINGYHVCYPELGILGFSGTLGTAFSIPVGWGIAAKKDGREQVVLSVFGDGESNRSVLHGGFNMAATWKLPMVWLCQNNLYAQHTSHKNVFPLDDIAGLAGGYGMPGVVVDGQDVLAVHEAVQAAVDRARAGDGPSLIECKTYRYSSHGAGLPDNVHASQRSAEEIEAWKKRDPITLFQSNLLEQGTLTKADVEKIDKEIDIEMEEVERFANESPYTDPSIVFESIFAE
jgi:pyruvate dehydrogenase E1 component alpha subunit